MNPVRRHRGWGEEGLGFANKWHHIHCELSSRYNFKALYNQPEVEGESSAPCGAEVTGRFSRIRSMLAGGESKAYKKERKKKKVTTDHF